MGSAWSIEVRATSSCRAASEPRYNTGGGDPGGIQLVTAMIRRDVLDELSGFDASYRYAEDRDLFIRMREHGVEIAVLDEVVLHTRLHGSNMTMNAPTNTTRCCGRYVRSSNASAGTNANRRLTSARHCRTQRFGMLLRRPTFSPDRRSPSRTPSRTAALSSGSRKPPPHSSRSALRQ